MQFICSFLAVFCFVLAPVLVHAQLTLGVVQSSIKEGMDQSEVAIALGSPNMVTQDAKGNETWIYDKISTTVTESAQSQGQRQKDKARAGIGIPFLFGLGGSSSQSNFDTSRSGTTTQSSKTLTVIIKFDENKLVKKVRFNQSAF